MLRLLLLLAAAFSLPWLAACGGGGGGGRTPAASQPSAVQPKANRLDGGPGTVFVLNASLFGPEPAVSVDWDFGDGRVATGASTQVSYPTPGVYPVVVSAVFPTAGRLESRLDLTVLDPAGGATLVGTDLPMPQLLGDVDGDLTLTSLDLAQLTSHVQGQSSLPLAAWRAGDIHLDGRLDQKDVDVLAAAVALGGALPEVLEPASGPRGTMCRLVSQRLRDVNALCEVQCGSSARQAVRRLHPGYGLFVVPMEAAGPGTTAPIVEGPVPVVLFVDGVAVQTFAFALTNPPSLVGDEVEQLRAAAPELFQRASQLRDLMLVPGTAFGTEVPDRAILAAMLDFAATQFAEASTAIDAFTDAMSPSQRDALAYMCSVAGLREKRTQLASLQLPTEVAAVQIGGSGNATVDLVVGVQAVLDLASAIQEVTQTACLVAAGASALSSLFLGPVGLAISANILSACGAMDTAEFVVGAIEALWPKLEEELDLKAVPETGQAMTTFTIEVRARIENGLLCGSALGLAEIVQGLLIERITSRLTVLGSFQLLQRIPFEERSGDLRQLIVSAMGTFLEGLGTALGYALNAAGMTQQLNTLKAQLCAALGSQTSISIAWSELRQMDLSPADAGWTIVPPASGSQDAQLQRAADGSAMVVVSAVLPTRTSPLEGSVEVLAMPNMVPIVAGTFQMGSPVTPLNVAPYYNRADAQPVHAVTITQPFWMGKYEVTQSEYQAVMGSNPSFFQGANLPVEQVSWNQAVAYCDALTVQEAAAGRLPSGYEYRLPTEAEWEYCCRAGTTTEFHYGAALVCSQANFVYSYHTSSYCSATGTAVVGSYSANAWGLHDMHGNVWEWCLDSWDGSANYPAGLVSDPYVTSGPDRVFRGGGFGGDSIGVRSAFRFRGVPGFTGNYVGFRVVCAPVR